MAAIYQAPPQAAPVVPVYQQQAPASTQIQDPLFEALAKYITQGPGPSAITPESIQSIIDSHSTFNGGREYLESIVNPTEEFPPLRIWKNAIDVAGFFSTSLSSWTTVASGNGVGIPYRIDLRQKGNNGVFLMQVIEFKNAKFYWDDLSDGEVTSQVTVKGGLVHIELFPAGDVSIPEKKAIAEFSFPVEHLKLPPILFGNGPISIAQ